VRNGITRWLAVTALLGAAVLAFSSVGTPVDRPARSSRAAEGAASLQLAAATPGSGTAARTSASTNGEDAVVALGSRLPAVARGYGWTAAELAETLQSDSTLHVDANDRLFYTERPPVDSATASATALAAAATPEAAAPYPLADTFKLHSLSNAQLTILLDFDGATMSDNGWTTGTIIAPAWSLDGAANPGFNDTEKAAIQDIWRRVAEDYAPFNVDVTTEFTSESVITRAGASDLNYGTRVLVSPISSYFGNYGGIAYVSVFDDVGDYYKPALVFPEMLSNSAKNIAEAASHEAGHNLGLRHDGTPTLEYYAGSGSGETGWAPIMGNGYGKNLTQWSRGEYPGANNSEDDLAIVAGYLAYRPDDAGDTTATAGVLPVASTISTAGVIDGPGDLDVYRFSAGAGSTSIAVNPAALGPDLDVYAEILRPDGSLVAASNPDTLLSASFSSVLPAGTYYLTVRGTGRLTPLDAGGYSNYASIGQYTVTGTVPFGVPVTTATPTPANAFTAWASSDVTISLVATEPISGVAWTRYSINGAAAVTYGGAPVVISTSGTTTFAYRSQNNVGVAEATQTATVRIDKVKPTTTSPGLLGSYPAGGGHTVTLSPSDGLSGVASTSWRIGTSGAFTAGVTATVPSVAGTYTLQYYSTDVVGNVEAVQSATVTVVDITPPVTAATVTPAAATSTWVSSNATITLTATDADPGVAWTRYRINGAAEQDYSTPIVISGSATSTVTYRSADLAGNTEATKTVTVRIDKVKPTTTAPGLLTQYAPGGGSSISLVASDAHSGVASTSWRIGTSGGFASGTTVAVPSAAGAYTLQFYSTDVAGNVGDVQTVTFWVFDLTPPTTTATVEPAAATSGWVSSAATVTLSATDAIPGVEWTRFSINGAAEQDYSAPVVISESGTATVAYRSADSSGNAEATKTVTVYVDATAPITDALDLASGYARDSGASVTLSATDAHSGVTTTQWRLGTNGAFTAGSIVPVPSGVGTYTLQYFSTDAVGNSEDVRSATFVVSPIPVTRIAGKDRYDTAVRLARAGWDPGNTKAWAGVKHVLIANGEPGREADPIGAAGLAGAYGAPVLLTQGLKLPGSTRTAIAEIAKANPGVRVHLIGSTSVVPDARWNDIKRITGVSQTKDRVYGSTRYSTSAAIARRIVALMGEPRIQGVLVVAVDNPAAFFDALAASPIAYVRTMPIVGVRKSATEPAAMNVLRNELAGKPIYFVNSDAFVTRSMKTVISASPSPSSLATSSDHYKASTQIAQSAVSRGWMSRADSGLAAKLPDALTGGAYMGLRGGVLLFTDSSSAIRPVTKSDLIAHKAEVAHGWVVGGTAAVPAAQETSFRNLLQ